MRFLEKDLETIVYEANKSELSDRGLDLTGRLLRQVQIGNYGVADLIHVYKRYSCNQPYLVVEVIEMKKDKVCFNTFLQAVRYVKGLQRFFEKRGFYNYVFHITLIGKEVDKSGSFIYLADLLGSTETINKEMISSLNIYEYHYDLTGLIFVEKSGYKLVNEGFKPSRQLL